MNEQEIIAKHAALISARDAFATKLAAALTVAGLTVKSTMPTEQWSTGTLAITSDKTKELEHYARLEILRGSRWSSTPDKVRLTYAQDGRFTRGQKTHYTKLDDALIVKIVELAVQGVADQIRFAAQRNTQANLEAHYAAVKKEQLAGVVLPPGTEVKIVASQNDTYAGKYYVSFQQHHGAITGLPLTAEQVKKLMAVLNEIQGTASGYVIVGTHPLDGRPVVRGVFSMGTDSPKMYADKQAALADIPHVSRDFANKDSLRVMPYADWMRI